MIQAADEVRQAWSCQCWRGRRLTAWLLVIPSRNITDAIPKPEATISALGLSRDVTSSTVSTPSMASNGAHLQVAGRCSFSPCAGMMLPNPSTVHFRYYC